MTAVRGACGTVTFDELYAYKYINAYDDTQYYISEYAILHKLHKYNHSNIIKMIECKMSNTTYSESKEKTTYAILKFKKYKKTLAYCNFTNDLDIIQIIIDILSALQLCHSINIWHRDIKLENIMLDDDNRAILIDFSHAKYSGKLNHKYNRTIQSVSYRAPEIFKLLDYNEKIDIYSIGVLLYNLTSHASLHSSIAKLYNAKSSISAKFTKFYNSDYINSIAEFYQQDQKPLFYNSTYLQWIKKMLDVNIKSRPSAREMLVTVLEFAAINGLNIKSPTWHSDIPIGIDETVISTTTLVNAMLIDVINKVNTNIDANHVANIIAKMETSNLLLTTIATVIIVDILDYDDGITISRYCNEHTDKKQINDEIITIINKYNSLLFFKIYDG
jgi:serine/threonine protein kinase